MVYPLSLPEHLRPIWDEVIPGVKSATPPSAIEAIVRQLWLMRDAESRIQVDGAVIIDAKGNAAEHPAIKIQRDAGRELRDWLAKYGAQRSL